MILRLSSTLTNSENSILKNITALVPALQLKCFKRMLGDDLCYLGISKVLHTQVEKSDI